MNFRRQAPVINMDEIAKRMKFPSEIATAGAGPEVYAQPRHRTENKVEQTIKTVDEFKALPTAEIDDVINAAKQELAALEKDAQEIRDDYIRKTDELKRNIKRIMAGCVLAHETMNELRKQVSALDNPPEIEEPKAIEDVKTETVKTNGW